MYRGSPLVLVSTAILLFKTTENFLKNHIFSNKSTLIILHY